MPTTDQSPFRFHLSVALKVALAYLVLGSVYILVSDTLVDVLAPTPAAATRWQSLKGWAYVLVTSLLLLAVLQLYVSRQNRIERELRRSEAELSAIVENAPFIMMIVDQDRRVKKINRHGTTFAGRPREELLGLRGGEALRCIHALDDPRGCGFGTACQSCTVRNTVLDTLEASRQHHAVEAEMTFHRQGREEQRTLLLYTNPIKVSGERQVIVVLQDITERRRMEAQLQQQQQLATVGQLAAGIAHDFRNLLTTILLYAEMDLQRPDLPPKVADDLEIIIEESNQATHLVQQMLDFSSRAMIQREPLNLVPFITHVIDNVLQRLIPENIALRLQATPPSSDGVFTVRADAGRIQQVLMNLALNARDAMPQGGELRLHLSLVSVSPGEPPPVAAMPAGDFVCLTVSDTGTGMTEEVRKHAFEPFFTTKEVGQGTGLGLPQVYGIVRQHDGYLHLESEKGVGSTFRIYLPREQAACDNPGGERPNSALPRGQGQTVLVVEDAQEILRAVQDGLTSLNYRVLSALNGREALETVATQSVDLVLTDLVMPKLGGRALLQELSARTPQLPVVAMTGYVMETDVEALKRAGFSDVITKPFSVENLARVVRSALE